MKMCVDLVRLAEMTVRLSREDERAAIIAAQSGDGAARDRLVRSTLALVAAEAAKRSWSDDVQLDFAHEGIAGVLHALKKFDVSRGFRFSSYALWWIRQRIDEAMPSAGETRPTLTRHARYTIRYGMDGSEAVAVAARAANDAPVVRLDAPAVTGGGDGDVTWAEWIADESTSDVANDTAERITAARVRAEVVLCCRSDLHRAVVYRRILADKPERLVDVARDHGVSRQRAWVAERWLLEQTRQRVLGRKVRTSQASVTA